MPGFGGIAGLSGMETGYQEQQQTDQAQQLRQWQLDDLKRQQAADQAFKQTIQAAMPGAMPMPGQGGPGSAPPQQFMPQGPPQQAGPQPGPPVAAPQQGAGIPQAPTAPQMAMPNMGRPPVTQPGPAVGGARGPQAGMPVGAPQGQGTPQGDGLFQRRGPMGMPQFDLQTAAKKIIAANPGIDGTTLVYALQRAQQFLKPEDQMQVRMMALQLQQQRVQEQIDALEERKRHDKATEDVAGRRTDLAEKREGRLERKDLIKQDVDYQRLDIQRGEALRKAMATQNATDIRVAHEAIVAAHYKAISAIQSSSAFNTMTKEERQKVIDEQNQETRTAIDQLNRLHPQTGRPADTSTPPAQLKQLPDDYRTKATAEIRKAETAGDQARVQEIRKQIQDMGYDPAGL